MFPPLQDLYRLAPEIVLCAFGMLIMLIDPFVPAGRRRSMGWLAFAGTLAALASLRWAAMNTGSAYSGLLRMDTFSLFVHGIVISVAALAILGSFDYLDREGIQRGEYYALILFATAGMGILAGATELLTAFIGLEMSSISTYILAGFRRNVQKSNEASLKYFLLGSFATAFFLYGIALTYGATRSTRFDVISQAIATHGTGTLLILGLGLIFVGLGFKVVAAPFQIYTPDVYEGAPTPVTAILACGPKAAAFALMLRIFYSAFGGASHIWFWAIWVSAVLTMCIGNFAALVQTNVKRLLAYSSIAHAGYILVAFVAASQIGVAAVLFYLAAYAAMTLGAFLIVAHVGGTGEQRLAIADYAGLGAEHPWVAASFALFLFSLLGLPATAGFLAKFYAFQAALDQRIVWLVVIAAINSVIGAYYYLKVVVAMYFHEPNKQWPATPMRAPMFISLLVTSAATIYLGVLPDRLMQWAIASARSLR
ncbi:MAG TPA: NADH-quinone oxidoreductase subunit N [Candidatus Limnocylindrales bacterium]|nr:NADH-quinone oxidoreductase subunit N [Candidatus Limnocylindrales bacterium]